MSLFFNNVIKTKIVTDNMGIGRIQNRRIMDSSQVLYDNPFQNKRGFHDQRAYSMRPEDVFSAMQHQDLPGQIVDTRLEFNGQEPIKLSKRQNGCSTHYVSRVVDNLKKAITHANIHQTQDWAETLSNARSNCRENKIRSDKFFASLLTVSDFKTGKSVTVNQLKAICPHLEDLAKIILPSKVEREIQASNFNSNHWGGSNQDTIVASALSSSVPALMIDTLITKVHFIAHNETLDRSFIVDCIMPPLGFSGNINMIEMFQLFSSRLVTEVLNDLSRNGHFGLFVEGNFDVWGISRIKVGWNGEPAVPYVIPSHADTLFTPVTTSNLLHLNTIAQDAQNLCSSVGLSDISLGNHHGIPLDF
jgi:hypothetical protein